MISPLAPLSPLCAAGAAKADRLRRGIHAKLPGKLPEGTRQRWIAMVLRTVHLERLFGEIRQPFYCTVRAGSWFEARRKAMRAFGEVSPQAVYVVPCPEKIVAIQEPEALPVSEAA